MVKQAKVLTLDKKRMISFVLFSLNRTFVAMKTAIIGGGAAGFFLAVNLKEMMPEMEVTIFERSQHVLSKVAVSGGGRCNCTNSFRQVSDLATVYPRGHRLMKRLFRVFSPQDAYQWFEKHGVPLVTQSDECVFPQDQDSHAVIDCFLSWARRYQIKIEKGRKIQSLNQLTGLGFDNVVVTTGGSPSGEGVRWLADLGHEVEKPVPSLFSFSIDDTRLQHLQGLVVADVSVRIPSAKLCAEGALLITHWGLSGPAILRLSSYAARMMEEHHYQVPVGIHWVRQNEAEVQAALYEMAVRNSQKQLTTCNPFGLQQRLWNYLVEKTLAERAAIRWQEVNKKDVNRLANTLVNDTFQTAGRAPFKDEFVTCGGISLKAVNPTTLESRHVPHLYFAGEVLDIDGVTGGFNFQAAWTTAYAVAKAITSRD